MLINVLTIITVIAGILIFERAYEQGRSLLWHATKFWMIAIVVGLQSHEYINIVGWYLPLFGVVFWLGWDILWNYQHNCRWWYAGDGKGNYIELAVSWLYKPFKNTITYNLFMLLVKFVCLIGSIYLIIGI